MAWYIMDKEFSIVGHPYLSPDLGFDSKFFFSSVISLRKNCFVQKKSTQRSTVILKSLHEK